MAASTACTPAPTLGGTSTTKGSILELHSINEEFDGKLSRVLEGDEDKGESDKIFVRFLDNEEKRFRVKKMCCRRPDIKPFKLRLVVVKLANQFMLSAREINSQADSERDKAKIKSLLERTHAVGVLLEALGWIVMYGDERLRETMHPSVELALVAVKHFRRALRCLYAYRDLVTDPDGHEQYLEMRISELLTRAGHNKSAIRMHPRVLNSPDPKSDLQNLVSTEFYAALALKNRG